jgi:hypothetical protein
MASRQTVQVPEEQLEGLSPKQANEQHVKEEQRAGITFGGFIS